MFLGQWLHPGQRLQRRIQCASDRCARHKTHISRIADSGAREEAARLLGSLLPLVEQLELRSETLPLTASRSFSWLWEDTELMLARCEERSDQLEALLSRAELTTAEPLPESTPTAAKPPPAPNTEPAPSLMEAMRRAGPPSPPPPPVDEAPRRERPFTAPALASQRKHPLNVQVTHANLQQDVIQWSRQLKEIGEQLRKLEFQPRPGFEPATWRSMIHQAQRCHREAAERMGRCQCWTRGPASLLRGNLDWVREFQATGRSVTESRRSLNDLLDTEPNRPVATPADLILIPIGPSEGQRSQPPKTVDKEED